MQLLRPAVRWRCYRPRPVPLTNRSASPSTSMAGEVEQTPERCVARAQFSSNDRQAIVQLTRYAPASFFEVTVAGSGLRADETEPRVTVAPSQMALAANGIQPIASGDLGGAAFTLALPANELSTNRPVIETRRIADQIAASIQYMRIEGLFSETIHLETGSSADFLIGLNRCTDALVSSWGLDPAEQRAATRGARPINYQAQADAGLRFSGPQTPSVYQARLLVLIDNTGHVTECRTIPADAPLDKEAGCRQMKRDVRYEPALDSTGQPIASYGFSTMIFHPG